MIDTLGYDFANIVSIYIVDESQSIQQKKCETGCFFVFARDFLPQKYLVELYENINNEISKSFHYKKKY